MKRTRRPFLALLFLALACEVSFARQSQGNDSSPMYATALDTHTRAAGDVNPMPAVPSSDTPGVDGRRTVDTTSQIAGGAPGTTVYYFYEPYPLDVGSSILQIGVSASLLPYPDSEQEIPIPGLDIQYKRGIFSNVSFVTYFSTSFFSNLLHAGIQWNAHAGRFSIGLADHVGGAYGFITRPNLFDNVQAYGLFDMAILRLGYRFDDFSFSSSFVITYVFKSRSYVNGREASVGPQYSINDYYCTLVVEQPFLKSQLLSIGFSLGYTRTPYQSWMLYDTTDEWLFVPEFFFAVQL